MTFSDVFLPVPFLASPFDLHQNVLSASGPKSGGVSDRPTAAPWRDVQNQLPQTSVKSPKENNHQNRSPISIVFVKQRGKIH